MTERAEPLAEVAAYLTAISTPPVAAEVMTITARLKQRYGERVQAVLLYGSTLHRPDVSDAVIDLYVLMDSYTDLYANRLLACANQLLAPNVFYMQTQHGQTQHGQTLVRCKYAVISLSQFAEGCRHWFHSYLWGRFCQPVRLVYAASAAVQTRIIMALAQSCYTLLNTACVHRPGEIIPAEELWATGLSLSYRAELRPEDAERAALLVKRDADHYLTLTRLLLPLLISQYKNTATGVQIVADRQSVNRLCAHWRWRRWLGRLLSVLRLVKAAFTFNDCIDYAAWKIQRHTGEVIDVTPKLRKYPLLFGWQVGWRLLRRGVLK